MPSQSFGGGDGRPEVQVEIGVSRLLQTTVEAPLWKQVTFWAVLFLFVILVTLLSPELRKKLLLMFLRFALLPLVISYIIQKRPDLLANLFGKFGSMGQLPATLNPVMLLCLNFNHLKM
ncbi:MAG: hypothetical protein U0Z26_13545 [Anaerolineales bacterium]